MEVDWIRDSSKQHIQGLRDKYDFELIVGSVHHVNAVPIDYDRELYVKAREISGGRDELLFQGYFDAQFDMLQALRPPVVGHFDLIRLKSDNPNGSFKQWEQVWKRIERNLDFIAKYGGIVELNSAALRKGMREPYPNGEICGVCFIDIPSPDHRANRHKALLRRGGRFTLSDDSHGIDQVGYAFERVLSFAEQVGITDLQILASRQTTQVAVNELRRHEFFTSEGHRAIIEQHE